MKEFSIGADPEFVAISKINPNAIVYAYDLCRSTPAFSACPEIDSCGTDGCESIFELRAEPSYEPLEVISNIHDILQGFLARSPKAFNYQWRAGSFYCKPLGGHIHLGHLDIRRHPLRYTEAMAQYIGVLSILLEKRSEALMRRMSGYGDKNNIRRPSFGIEYRALGSWLTSPYIAAAILCLTKIVIHEALNNKLKIPRRITSMHFAACDITHARSLYPTIWKEITQMELYPKYAAYIEIIKYLIDNKLSWNPKVDMKKTWGLANPAATQSMTKEQIWSGFSTI